MSGDNRPDHAIRLFLVAGEHSGDALGARLMASLRTVAPRPLRFAGIGGPAMTVEGLRSEFPLSEVAVMGPLDILARLPQLFRCVKEAAAAGIAFRPDAVVIIDSPEFTHPVARRIRRSLPGVPVIDYVSPSVWAWRPGRARRMRAYVDHVLALLPFEPAAHVRLGGPPCSYVGHPLVEHVPAMVAADPDELRDRLGFDASRRTVVVLPGSRRSEVDRLMQPFGGALGLLSDRLGGLDVVIPAVESVRDAILQHTAHWPIPAHVVGGDDDKYRAFRAADVALAASGTVTLELALAGVPMVVAYRVDPVAARLGFLIKTPHFALSNLVLGERAFPELMQDNCTPARLADALAGLLTDPATMAAQRQALARVPGLMRLADARPSETAARLVLSHVRASTRLVEFEAP